MAELAATVTVPSSSDLLVEIDHVVFGYDARRTILNDVSMTFGRGKVTAILGGSGCGKTTLLRLIGGVYPTNSGTVRVFGEAVDAHDDEQLFALRRRLGMLFQFGALFTDLSVFDNVAGPKQLVVFDRAMHEPCIAVDRTRWASRVTDFLLAAPRASGHGAGR